MRGLTRRRWFRIWGVATGLGVLLTTVGGQGVHAADSHTVRYGDTLSQIALSYGFTVDELVLLNGIEDPDLIITGEILQLGSNRAESTHSYSGAWDTAESDEPSDDGWTDVEPAGDEFVEEYVAPPCCPDYVDPWTVQQLLVDTASDYGWDPTLIMAQAWQESYWGQHEVSWVGAIGVMQVMPATAAGMNDWYFARDRDIWGSVADNIEMGVAYLTMLYEETGDVELALASYYQGWASVQRDGFFPDTHEYVDRIFMFQEMFRSGELP
jgi:hypothetical protein